jgi:hypothetical protein
MREARQRASADQVERRAREEQKKGKNDDK